MSFVPLHVHTEYSLLDGMSTVNELAEAAKKNGFPGIAITDHGTMMGVKEFHCWMRRDGIKPIIGDEIYLTDYYDHRLKDEDHRHCYHLVLLAKNLTGYRNLCKIASIGATEGLYKTKARVSHEVLKQYSEGLICLSACIGGEIPQLILDEDIDGAKESILWYKGVFGEDFYLEVCLHPNSRPGKPQEVFAMQNTVCDELFRLGAVLGVKVVATNDSHFTYKEQAFAHDVMLAMNCRKPVSDENRLHYTGEEYLKNEEEMLAVFPDHPEAIGNTMDLYAKIEEYELDAPRICCPLPFKLNEGEDAFSVLKAHAEAGFDKLFNSDCAQGRVRLEKELTVIKEKGFENQFLLLEDIVKYAKKEGIMYGPGRGFAASSLVNYCLGVTKVNPLAYGLCFERLLNDKTKVFAGVDIDFEYGSSGKVVSYLKEKFGENAVGGLICLCTKGCRTLLEEACNALEVCQADKDRLKAILPEDNQIIVYQSENDIETYKLTCENIRKYVQKAEDLLDSSMKLRKVFSVASSLEGRKTSYEVSLCAVMVSDRALSDTLPVMLGESKITGSEEVICQYEKYHSEDAGVLRLNFLELRTLNVIHDTLSEIAENTGASMSLDGLISDPESDLLMNLGDTDGVLLFESPKMREFLVSFKRPPKFSDLAALNALYRPGLLNRIPKYLVRANNASGIKKWGIPELDAILAETNGILIYQEQMVSFFKDFLRNSDNASVAAYKALAKRKGALIAELKKEFLAEGKQRRIHERTLVKVWNQLYDDSLYAFSKSHCVCYVSIAYQCAYLKAHYRELFMRNWRKYNCDI